jgi:hypothetical protein
MKKISLIVMVILLSKSVLYARTLKDTLIEKTGWLVYYSDKVMWFDSDLKKNPKDKHFFSSRKEYLNGLVVNYIPISKYYKSIASCYAIRALSNYDTVLQRAEYMLTDSICILPVKVKFKISSQPVSELLTPMGLSFVRNNNEVTLSYNFETNYNISEIRLLRKKDKRRIKRVRDYLVDPAS